MTAVDHWFFLSYARADRDPYLAQFFADLAQAVRQKAALGSVPEPDDIGFVDSKGLRVGGNWPDDLRDALLGSRVLVPLYSRSYFNSDYCGRELEVFRRRLHAWRTSGQTGDAPPLALPVLWDSPKKLPQGARLPSVLRPLQTYEEELGAAYGEHGLLRLVKMRESRHHDDYLDFVDAFAERLVDTGRPAALPRCDDIPPLASLPSALVDADVIAAAPSTGASPPGVGTVQFVFVAGTRDEVAQVREQVEGYGTEGGRDWCPYYPQEPQPVGVLSQIAASQERLFYEHLPLGADFEQHLEKADSENTIVLLVVDPWSASIDEYKKRLKPYDQRRWLNSEVLVAWNPEDPHNADEDALRERVRSALQALSEMESSVIREGVATTESFEQTVIDAINEIRTRLARVGRIMNPIEQAGAEGLPILNAASRG